MFKEFNFRIPTSPEVGINFYRFSLGNIQIELGNFLGITKESQGPWWA
jgi:hypothetical protein